MTRRTQLHRAWIIAAVVLLTIVGAAGFRATPGVLLTPLHEEFGWSRGTISFAVSVNLLLYGLISPFAAALMERHGVRRVVSIALVLVAAGSGATIWMSSSWQLVLLWGVLVGAGTGSMALALVALIVGRWFVRHRGLVTGVLTAGGATGQLIFLPVLANLVEAQGWRTASLTVAAASLSAVPLVVLFVRDYPRDVGLTAYGSTTADDAPPRSSVARPDGALATLRRAARTRTFWLLAGGFAICGASTNGLIGVHFIPAAHDHGMPEPTAAGLLAVVGVFDIVGTIASGWLTDRFSSRVLLGGYYALRGASLLLLPHLLAEVAHPSLLIFVVFYGLDWVATVPPTIYLCRQHFGDAGPVVFGWVFASHQVGAALAATVAGSMRDSLGAYTLAFTGAGLLCFAAAAMSLSIGGTGGTGGPPADREQPDRTEQRADGADQQHRGVAAGDPV